MKIGLVVVASLCFLFASLGVFRAMIELLSRYRDRRWIRIGLTLAVIAGVLGTAIMLFSRSLSK